MLGEPSPQETISFSMMKRNLLPLVLLCSILYGCTSSPTDISVIPIPVKVELEKGCFHVDNRTKIHIESSDTVRQNFLSIISESPLCFVEHTDDITYRNVIIMRKIYDCSKESNRERYCMTITSKNITIEACTDAGLFYGLQTLLQLVSENKKIPQGTIVDEPRFAYRGMMLDVSRHFFDVDFVKKQIDAMAYYKMNHLHLHLTDAAGWRLEIKRYPLLTQKAAWRTHPTWKEWWNAERRYVEEGNDSAYGGYYTQEQIRDLVAYAQKRHITIVPEIEMPSHSEEVLAVYPGLSCSHAPYKESDFCIGNEQTFEFLENVLTEVMELFPSEYIHIGGDEASKQSWKSCSLCQARMRNEGLNDVDELQSYLIHRVDSFLTAHGRKLLGWDEILDGGLAPNATVMSWRGNEGGLRAIRAGHRAIMTPGEYCYLDAYQDAPHTQPEAFGGYLPLKKVYAYEPLSDGLTDSQEALLYGVQGNLFAEYIPTEEHMEYMMYPRMLAIAEVGWSSPKNKDYEHFYCRVQKAIKQLQQVGYNAFDISSEVGNRPGADRPMTHLAVGKKVSYVDGSAYYNGYAAGGDSALVDGWRGGWTYGDKRWQGFLGRKGVDVVIDLDEILPINAIHADFMQICGPGVFMPSEIIISTSTDGTEFAELHHIYKEVVRDDSVSFCTLGWEGEAQARYIRYQALRSHHGGFLFVDEIVVE